MSASNSVCCGSIYCIFFYIPVFFPSLALITVTYCHAKNKQKLTSNQGKIIEPKQNLYIIPILLIILIIIIIIMIILFNNGKTLSRILANLIGLYPKLQ